MMWEADDEEHPEDDEEKEPENALDFVSGEVNKLFGGYDMFAKGQYSHFSAKLIGEPRAMRWSDFHLQDAISHTTYVRKSEEDGGAIITFHAELTYGEYIPEYAHNYMGTPSNGYKYGITSPSLFIDDNTGEISLYDKHYKSTKWEISCEKATNGSLRSHQLRGFSSYFVKFEDVNDLCMYIMKKIKTFDDFEYKNNVCFAMIMFDRIMRQVFEKFGNK